MACNNCNECNPCSPTPCVDNHDCECKVFLNDTCITTTEDMPYTGILKGKTLGEWILALDEYLQDKFASIENFFKLINVGVGAGKIYKGISILGEKQIKSILGTNLITVNNLTDEVEIEIDETAMITFIEDNQKTYSTENIGTGASIYKDSTIAGANTEFNLRKIKSANSSVTITEGTDDIDLAVLVDTTITDGSPNPISSNAVFDALATIVADIKYEALVIPITDLVTNITTGVSKAYFRMPFAATINSVRASVLVAQTAGSILTFDIHESGVSILSTKLTIDNNEKTSLTAATPAVISDTSLADDSEITFNIDQIGTVGAKGAIITLLVTRV